MLFRSRHGILRYSKRNILGTLYSASYRSSRAGIANRRSFPSSARALSSPPPISAPPHQPRRRPAHLPGAAPACRPAHRAHLPRLPPPPTARAAARRGQISRSLAAAWSRFVCGMLPRRPAQASRRRCLPRAGRQLGAHKVSVEITASFVPPRPIFVHFVLSLMQNLL